MALITPKRINDLKARVKAECTERAFSGSVSSYAGAAYDFTNTPASGVVVAQEHITKIATPLNAINSDAVTLPSGQAVITDGDITTMEAFMTVLEKRDKTDHTSSDCKGGCTGMCFGCQGTCYNACTSCTGCSDTCTGSCKGTCSGCSGCGDYCSSGCGTSCGKGCAATCNNSCSGCRGTCSGSCSGCGGCGGSCSGQCTGGCGGNCKGGYGGA